MMELGLIFVGRDQLTSQLDKYIKTGGGSAVVLWEPKKSLADYNASLIAMLIGTRLFREARDNNKNPLSAANALQNIPAVLIGTFGNNEIIAQYTNNRDPFFNDI
ncbi:MAG: hypothetical protein NC826_04820 [Candidatus Omnitrophica bacterium]|nr:hypothetical protein [Candidatus Omnitrophota bacterium]